MDQYHIESLIYTLLNNRTDEVECVDTDDGGVQVYLKDGGHFTIKVTKNMTQEDAQELYDECMDMENEEQEVLRKLSAEELKFLTAVVDQDRMDDLRWDYSGRGMFGRQTLAVDGEPFSCEGVRLCTDSMGLGIVTYIHLNSPIQAI